MKCIFVEALSFVRFFLLLSINREASSSLSTHGCMYLSVRLPFSFIWHDKLPKIQHTPATQSLVRYFCFFVCLPGSQLLTVVSHANPQLFVCLPLFICLANAFSALHRPTNRPTDRAIDNYHHHRHSIQSSNWNSSWASFLLNFYAFFGAFFWVARSSRHSQDLYVRRL